MWRCWKWFIFNGGGGSNFSLFAICFFTKHNFFFLELENLKMAKKTFAQYFFKITHCLGQRDGVDEAKKCLGDAEKELSHQDYTTLEELVKPHEQWTKARAESARKAAEYAQRKEQERVAREVARARINDWFQTNFDGADDLYHAQFAGILSQDEYAQLKQKHQEQEKARLEAQEKEKLLAARKDALARLEECFEADFIGAENLYCERFAEVLSRSDYDEAKCAFVKNWFEQNALRPNAQQPNDEQIAAIASINENVLLKARAGSGKTSVVAERTRFLIQHAGIKPDEIMLLAFNKKAAEGITHRIQTQCGIGDFNNARTFHSLAWQVAPPAKTPLFDEKGGGVSTAQQKQFVQKLVNGAKNIAFLLRAHVFFRAEITEMESLGSFLSKEDYYLYRRNHRQATLKGDSVKSLGEKYIGDFLFEHGIAHNYEQVWWWDNRNYRPDFTLNVVGAKKPRVVIEHWGIDENDSNKQVSDLWDGSWDDYKTQMEEKRAYWKSDSYKRENVLFLETSIADLRPGREHFEKILCRKLTDAGVVLTKLDNNALAKKVNEIRIGKLTTMFLQFIQRAKNQRLSPDDVAEKINGLGIGTRPSIFSHMANKIYSDYVRELDKTDSLDFNDLLEHAIDKVQQTKGDCAIPTADGRSIKINQLKYLMIDEYQDFSPLFFNLVDAIRRCNPAMKVFCVGDDWQAINAFAGSDLKYFESFDKYIDGAKHLALLTNHRSATSIVDISNRFMAGRGEQSRAYKTEKGEICKRHTDEIRIERRTDAAHKQAREFDRRFVAAIKGNHDNTKYSPNKSVMAKTLKACYTIITDDSNRNKRIAILSKTNSVGFYYESPAQFKSALKETCKGHPVYRDFDKLVDASTTHGYKGREADIVIMLFVNDGAYPLIHPDSDLYEILGATPQKTLDEERRLFYVGLTRAKEKLYLLCESEIESDFLREITGNHPLDDNDDDYDNDIPF